MMMIMMMKTVKMTIMVDAGDAAKTHFLGGDNLNNVAQRTFCLIALPFSSLC